MVTGIYKIENIDNGKVYIGKAENVFRRWLEHQHLLQKGIHHSTLLQEDWNVYGLNKFTFQIVRECDFCDLDKYEEKYAYEYEALVDGKGYNIQKIGDIQRRTYSSKIIDSIKCVVDFGYFIENKISYFDTSQILYLLTFINGEGYIINKNKEKIKHKYQISEMLNTSKHSFDRISKMMTTSSLLLKDKEGYLYVNKSICKKAYELKPTNKKYEYYIYVNYIRQMYDDGSFYYAKIIDFLDYINEHWNCLCNKNDVKNSEYEGVKKTAIFEKESKYHHDMSKAITTITNHGKYSLFKNKDNRLYINPLFIHKANSIKNLKYLVEIFDNKI